MPKDNMKELVSKHESDIKELQLATRDLHNSLESINGTLREILSALKGNDLSGERGYSDRISLLEKQIRVLFKFKDTFWIYFSIITSVIVAVTTFFVPIFQKIVSIKLGL